MKRLSAGHSVLLVLIASAIVSDSKMIAAEPPYTAATFSPDGKQILLGSQRGLEIRSYPDWKLAGRLKTDLLNLHDLAFSPDGQTLLAAGGSPGEEGIVEVWDWKAQQRARRVAVHSDVVYRVAWSPMGSEWSTASADGTCRVIEHESGHSRLTYSGHSRPVLSLGYIAGGKYLASAGVDQTLQLWDAASGELVHKRDNHLAAINDLVLRPTTDAGSAPIVATAGEDRTVRFWQPVVGRMMRFAKLPSPPRVIAWTADGSRLLCGCTDGGLRIVDPDTAEIVSEEPLLKGRIQAIALSPDGSSGVVAGEDRGVRSISQLLPKR
jgi:WD40 repeat protein